MPTILGTLLEKRSSQEKEMIDVSPISEEFVGELLVHYYQNVLVIQICTLWDLQGDGQLHLIGFLKREAGK